MDQYSSFLYVLLLLLKKLPCIFFCRHLSSLSLSLGGREYIMRQQSSYSLRLRHPKKFRLLIPVVIFIEFSSLRSHTHLIEQRISLTPLNFERSLFSTFNRLHIHSKLTTLIPEMVFHRIFFSLRSHTNILQNLGKSLSHHSI